MFWRPQGFPQAAWEALGVLEDSPPHVVLGAPPKVSRRDVARAYKSLALRFHPDKTMDDTADVMKILSKARDRLLSAEKHDDKEPEKKESGINMIRMRTGHGLRMIPSTRRTPT